METVRPRRGPLRWRVAIEVPYDRPDTSGRLAAYLTACIYDCIEQGEAPVAAPWLLTPPADRDDRLFTGHLAWAAVVDDCDAVICFTDLGYSPGMVATERRLAQRGRFVEQRALGGEWAARPEEE